MHEQQRCQSRIVRVLARNLKAFDQFEPAIHDVRSFFNKRELIAERPNGLGRCRGGPAQAIGRLRPRGDGPELHQDLSADEYGLPAGKEAFYGRLRGGVLRAPCVHQSQEHVGIEEPAN